MPAWLHGPVYGAMRAVLAGVGMVDIADAVRTARSVGRLYATLEPRRVKRAIDAIGVAFPGMPEDQREFHAIRAYEHLFTLGVEMAFTPRLITRDGWSRRVRLGRLTHAVRELLGERPCVLITGHCGNWELLGYTMALLGFPMHALYRPLDLPPLDSWVRRTRQTRGLVLLDKFGATEVLPELMDRRGMAGFIADQNAGDRGMFVPFFNRLASTYKSIGLLALQFDAPIICGQARRLVAGRDESSVDGLSVGMPTWAGDPFCYEIDVVDVIHPEDWKSQPDPLFYASARYRRALEDMVRRSPEQNLWLHRYWKSRPKHERMGRPFPAALREKIRALPWTTDEDMARIEDWSARDAAAIAAGHKHA